MAKYAGGEILYFLSLLAVKIYWDVLRYTNVKPSQLIDIFALILYNICMLTSKVTDENLLLEEIFPSPATNDFFVVIVSWETAKHGLMFLLLRMKLWHVSVKVYDLFQRRVWTKVLSQWGFVYVFKKNG